MGMRIFNDEKAPVDPGRWGTPGRSGVPTHDMRVSGIARSSAPVDPGRWGDIARALRRALRT